MSTQPDQLGGVSPSGCEAAVPFDMGMVKDVRIMPERRQVIVKLTAACGDDGLADQKRLGKMNGRRRVVFQFQCQRRRSLGRR